MGRTYNIIGATVPLKDLGIAVEILETIRNLYEKQYTEYLQNTWLARLYKYVGLYTADDISKHALVNLTEPQLYYTHHEIKIGKKSCTTSMYCLDNRIDLLKDIIKSSKNIHSITLSAYEYEDYYEAINKNSDLHALCNTQKYDSNISAEMGYDDVGIYKISYRGPIHTINKLLGGNIYNPYFEELDFLISQGAVIVVTHQGYKRNDRHWTEISDEQAQINLDEAINKLQSEGYELYPVYSEWKDPDNLIQGISLVKSSTLAEFKKGVTNGNNN